jgi:Zn-dependent M28 family amino/carboxypeptidase
MNRIHAALSFVALSVVAPPAGAQVTVAPPAIDGARLMADLHALAHDSMEGRRAGTAGAERARRFIEKTFAESGLKQFGPSWRRPFAYRAGRGGASVQGENVIGYLPGTGASDRVIVLSAHYDHLGERDGQIFNGADDNASGVSAILAMARMFAAAPPRHTIVFIALDAEESGLQGARAFVADPPIPASRIAIDVNLDMVSRNEAGELWVAGTHHTPSLRPFIDRLAGNAHVRLRVGHDQPDVSGQDDWTGSSDHGPFHAAGIPFLYFGVEDHADYHRESDEAGHVEPDFFRRSVQTIADIVLALDASLEAVVPGRR